MEEQKKIESWSVEGSIYPQLDAMGMRGETSYKQEFGIGENHKISISVSSRNGSPVSLHQQFKSSDIDFKMHFRSGSVGWFRVDNQGGHNYLHMHIESGAQPFDCRIPISENTSVSQIISNTFEEAEKIVKWKFPDFVIGCGSDFLGTA